MMDDKAIQSQLSECYVRALASRCRCTISTDNLDLTSDDLGLKYTGPKLRGKYDQPSLAIQLKSTFNWAINDDGIIKYSLGRKNYMDLISKVQVPKILVLYCMPRDIDEWLLRTNEHLLLKHCAYWLNLKGLPPLPPTVGSRTLHIPSTNHFDLPTLNRFMAQIARKGSL